MENLEKSNESALNALKQQLEGAGVVVSEWGKGQAKTLAHLQKEIESGETVLVTGEQGELLRKVVVGSADIFYTSPDDKKYRLKEDKQILTSNYFLRQVIRVCNLNIFVINLKQH